MFTVQSLRDLEPAAVIELARRSLAAAVPIPLRDDRFGESWADQVANGWLIGAYARDGDQLVGFAGGILLPEARTVALDCVSTDLEALTPLVKAAVIDAVHGGATRVELWRKPSEPADTELMDAIGATPYRALHQMRCQLPLDVPILDTRAFRPGDDDADLVRVNNRAFSHHPSQGTLTIEALQSDMTQPWFDPEGLRMYEVDGALAGFCWTKRHAEPALGEVYVICIDPDFHGQGLGRPMTAAGLHWLAEQGETVGMLYVEADNVAAIKTYEGLGFRVVRTDRAWVLVS